MKDGTPCDLTHQPRQTRVLYVCQPDGHGEVYQLKETSTCEYEVMVLTSILCSHPLFRSGGSVSLCVSLLMCVCMTIIYVCECVYAVIICALSSMLFRQLYLIFTGTRLQQRSQAKKAKLCHHPNHLPLSPPGVTIMMMLLLISLTHAKKFLNKNDC